MFSFVLSIISLFTISAHASDTLYYVCMGDDPTYQVAALQQVIVVENDMVTGTFVLDVAAKVNEYMTRYAQKGDIVFKSEPLLGEDTVVIGTFERDGKEIAMQVIYSSARGYRMKLDVDARSVEMPCRRKF